MEVSILLVWKILLFWGVMLCNGVNISGCSALIFKGSKVTLEYRQDVTSKVGIS